MGSIFNFERNECCTWDWNDPNMKSMTNRSIDDPIVDAADQFFAVSPAAQKELEPCLPCPRGSSL